MSRPRTRSSVAAHPADPAQPAMSPQSGPLSPHSCESCGQSDGLTPCIYCHGVLFCREHRHASAPEGHRSACHEVWGARLSCEELEAKVRQEVPDAFENGLSEFWYVHETRMYINSRYRYAQLLLHEFGSTDDTGKVTGRIAAVEAALEHMLGTLRLARVDPLDARGTVPALYLALERDQEAYDFMMWYTVADDTYEPGDWTNPTMPYLEFKDEDVLEGLWEEWTHEPGSPLLQNRAKLTHVVAVLLIKVRAYLDLLNAQNAARALAGTLPAEIVDLIRTYIPRGALSSRPDVLRSDVPETATVIENLKAQIWALWRAARQRDKAFWDRMLGGGARDVARVEVLGRRMQVDPRQQERQDLEQRYQLTPWLITPGALGVVRRLRRSYFGYT